MTATTTDTRFTVDDYKALPEGFPAQLIEGGLAKEPARTWRHQGIALALAMRLAAVAGERRVLIAPADLVLDRWNVLQPDVLVFACDVAEAEARGGLPVLVAEVLSPGTEDRDRGVKCAAYLRAGIGEVWLVDPQAGLIDVRTRDGSARYGAGDEAASGVVPGFRVSLSALTG
jgi:Uma2 family endonuclease